MRIGSLILSAVFHGITVLLVITGLPFVAKYEFKIPPPIVVDFIEISKVTETDRISTKPMLLPPKKVKPKKKKPEPAVKNTSKDVVVPMPKEKPKPKLKPKPKPKEVKKKEVKTVPLDPNALPDKKKKKIEKKKVEKKKIKKKPLKDFSSVLKNLADPKKDKPTPKPTRKPASKAKSALESVISKMGSNAPLGAKMTMSEEDALRKQLEECWNVPFGAKDAENMSVEIFMVINRDRTLREARIVNMSRCRTDNFFRAAAESALRAVNSPLCSPFAVPPDKYDVWKTVTVTFNPKDMF